MKTPDEIKKGLECRNMGYNEKCNRKCNTCAVYVQGYPMENLYADALAYIQHLEAERDALLAALRRVDIDCDCCKHRIENDKFCEECDFDCGKCRNKENCRYEGCGRDNCNWEWCGIKEGAK